MAVDWRMGVMPDIGMNAMAAFQQGRQVKEQRDAKEAMAAYAVNPNESGLNALAQYDPKFVVETKQAQAGAQQKSQAEQLQVMGRLLEEVTPETYTQALNVAQRYGIDISQAPQQYDPNWVGEMRMLTRAATKDGGQQISGIARELIDAGYKPGTPEFETALRGVISNKYASEYVDDAGNMRRRSALDLGGGAPSAPSVPPAAISELRANPASATQFDEIFGPGASARILGNGGGVSNGTSGFRP